MFLQSLLDAQPDVPARTLRVSPVLPDLFQTVRVRNLRVGTERVDLRIEGGPEARVDAVESGSLKLRALPAE